MSVSTRYKKIQNWYLSIGVNLSDSITAHNARTINIFIVLIQLICFVSLIAGIILELNPVIDTMILFIGVLFIILYTQYKHYYLLSYYLFVTAGCAVISYLSYAMEYTGIHFYIISGLAVASVIYLKKRNHIHLFFVIGFLTFIASLWLSENSENQIDLDPTVQSSWLIFNVFSTFILVYFSGYFYTKSVLKQQEINRIANESIERQLIKNQLLLKEINHRVKNNFQIVSSLVEIQSKEIEDEHAQRIINEGQKRLKAMSLIHQKLYQNDDLTVDLSVFLSTLIANIHEAYALQPMVFKIELEDSVVFDADTSIPLGLIINELVTNSFKYAFNNGGEDILLVRLQTVEDNFVLTLSDNGPGIESRVDFMNSRSVGLRLVKRLVKQLQGQIDYQTNDGAEFKITFQNSKARSAID